jgi:DNA repair exonuclease SbcCD ATPase subunit
MDLEAELDRLYSLPLRDFVAARNLLAKRLLREKDREAAGRVKALVKPSLTAWAVNQLRYQAPDHLDALAAAAEKLRAGHVAGGDEHRSASEERRKALTAAVDRAAEILEAAGHPPTQGHRQRISHTLEALSAGGTTAEPRAGRLHRDLEPAGFDALTDLAAALAAAPRKPPRVAKPETAGGERVAETREQQERREEERRAAEERRRRARERERRIEEARRKLARQEKELENRRREATAARQTLADAERAQAAAEDVARQAERRAREARERADAARQAAEAASVRAESAAEALRRATGEVGSAREAVERCS